MNRLTVKNYISDQKKLATKFKLLNSLKCLSNYDEDYDKYDKRILKYYHDYVENFSSAAMAVSFPTSVFLLVLCEKIRPKRILDTGSGFSFFLMRYYEEKYGLEGTEIYSIDDDEGWMGKTQEFLDRYDQKPFKLMTYETFQKECKDTKFDLIFHDMGNMQVREESLAVLLDNNVAKGAHVIIDDMHMDEYAAAVRKMLDDRKVKYYDLEPITKDFMGRFSCLGILD
ncbi:MAG: putative O-methyltransferase YrrM [Gammaproteobacteria bacterium]|jgi:predicted O-methyltransferase YrrM